MCVCVCLHLKQECVERAGQVLYWNAFTSSHLCLNKRLFLYSQERVERAGGQVLYWNGHRVMGVLAMSRAIGDHDLRPYVIPEPEVCDL